MRDTEVWDRAVLTDLARRRRQRRMADMEWFEVLYKVYLSAFVAGFAALAVAGAIGDAALTPAQVSDAANRGPALLGLAVAALVVVSVRSGLNGGPVALEDADVRHVLTAPVDRGRVLRRPAVQRIRAAMFTGIVIGAVAGLLVARRFPGNSARWVAAGAAFGACCGALSVGSALLAHGLRLPRTPTTAALVVTGGWQLWAAAPGSRVPGPLDAFGHLALWPVDDGLWGAVAVAVAAGAALGGLMAASRLSVEALARRARLVSQLRFAATVQDVRTVLLLRRQLGLEHCRVSPWFRLRLERAHPTVDRSVRGLAHYPARRIGRVVLLVAAAAAAHVGVASGTSALAAVAGVALFVAGLDLCESLSQEVDQANLADSFPRERGELFLRHLVAPAAVAVVLVIVATAVATALRPGLDTLAMAALVGPLAVAGGFAGSVVNIVRGAPDQLRESSEILYMPPEVSGLTTVFRLLWPPAISIAAQLPTVAAVTAERDGLDPWAAASRASLAVAVLVVLVGGWVRQRDAIARWWAEVRTSGARQGAREVGP